jgi:FkbH-like protein
VAQTDSPPIKCVAWDLDGTLWSGVALESAPALPELDELALTAIDELEKQGILNSIASRNPPDVLELAESHPRLRGRFVAPQVGWGRKSAALRMLAEQLNIELESIALVDDDPFERAEVAHMLGVVRVLTLEELTAMLRDHAFSGGKTQESRRRVDAYRAAEQRREAAAARGGSYEDFLRWCEIVATLAPASPDDAARLAELAVRTNRFNSTRRLIDEEGFLARIGEPEWLVATMRLRDRFADDGLVAAASVDVRAPARPAVELLCVSCRTVGRGGAQTLLVALVRAARSLGASTLAVPCLLDDRNLPLRIALRETGFTAARDAREPRTGLFSRAVEPPPEHADWLVVEDALADERP